jgi:WD40 repeat protein
LAVAAIYRNDATRGADVYTADFDGNRTRMRLPNRVDSVCWSRDGTLLSVAGHRNVSLFSLDRNALLRTLEGHSNIVSATDFSHDGKTVASSSLDGSVRFWEIEDRFPPTELYYPMADQPFGFGFNADGQKLIAGYYKPFVEWNIATGVKTVVGEDAVRNIWNAVYSEDGAHILYCGGDWPPSESTTGSIRLLDAKTKQEVHTFDAESGSLPYDAIFTAPNDKYVAGAAKDSVKIWDRATKELQRTLERKQTSSDTSRVSFVKQISVDRDGRLVAAAYMSPSAGVAVWNLQTGEEVFSRSGESNFAVALSPDGALVADAIAHAINVTRIADGEIILTLPEHSGQTFSLQFSPDGERLLSAGKDGTMSLWNLSTGNQVLAFRFEGWIQRARFSKDGSMIAVGNHVPPKDGIIRIIRAPKESKDEV